jgi:hypothetical protein
MDFILDLVRNYKSRNAAYLSGIWASAGNDVENATDYIFHNKVGEPSRSVKDSSTYAGWSQILSRGTHNAGIRTKVERLLGLKLPSDTQFARNTERAEARMRKEWGGLWLDGANHGYWNRDAGSGKPYFGDVGPSPNAEVYTEYGIYLRELPGRYDLLNYPPSNARILIFWPGDDDPLTGLTDIPAIRQIIRNKAQQFAAGW